MSSPSAALTSRQAVEDAMAQPPEQPALDDQHRLLDLRLVARLPRPRRQDGGPVMRRHLGVGAVHLRVVEAGLDDGGLGVVRHDQLGHAADRFERAHMGVDPVGQRLRPARVREGEARRAQHGDENLRLAHFAGQPVDHDRHAVAGVIDEQPLARGVASAASSATASSQSRGKARKSASSCNRRDWRRCTRPRRSAG